MTEQMRQALDKEAEECKQDYIENNAEPCVGDVSYFIREGADWYRNNVWHDVSRELPDKGKAVLATTMSPKGRGIMEGGVTMVTDRGLLEVDHKGTFKKWAYIEDLLPDRTDS
jgi:hypothetical protein